MWLLFLNVFKPFQIKNYPHPDCKNNIYTSENIYAVKIRAEQTLHAVFLIIYY